MPLLADATQVAAMIERMSAWARGLRPGETGSDNLALVGVRSRGDVIACRVGETSGIGDVGTLDITLYRDDLSEASSQPVVRTTEVPFAVDGRDVVLIDDVLMSGRSVRAALSVLMDLGRPRRVWLAVLVDRGEATRELPIAADFAGMTYAGVQGNVAVRLTPTDDRDAVVLEA
ncbi:MAG: bifunctional pyr operon transcriptional regulator/uracil phosphoribosyltransferase PyrR, partial [Planctomycetota bacterium]